MNISRAAMTFLIICWWSLINGKSASASEIVAAALGGSKRGNCEWAPASFGKRVRPICVPLAKWRGINTDLVPIYYAFWIYLAWSWCATAPFVSEATKRPRMRQSLEALERISVLQDVTSSLARGRSLRQRGPPLSTCATCPSNAANRALRRGELQRG